jgi:hypothetical protein
MFTGVNILVYPDPADGGFPPGRDSGFPDAITATGLLRGGCFENPGGGFYWCLGAFHSGPAEYDVTISGPTYHSVTVHVVEDQTPIPHAAGSCCPDCPGGTVQAVVMKKL